MNPNGLNLDIPFSSVNITGTCQLSLVVMQNHRNDELVSESLPSSCEVLSILERACFCKHTETMPS